MINLPPVEKGAAAFEADYYGAATLIARKLGLKETPFTSADWLHGWAADNILDAKWISPNSGLERTILTNKESITKYFISNSYKNIYTVGLPFLYAPVMAGTSRIPDSLLIMPPHVSTHSKSRDYDNLKAFFLDIKKYSKNYSKISVCISGSCFENEQYVNFIKDKGFDIIFGAWIFDKNALIRMKTILSSFTTIISNSVGSHLAYAAYCGTRIIMASPLDKLDFDSLAKTEPQFMRFPHLIPILKKDLIENPPEKRFPFLFQENQCLNDLKNWADNELGAAFMKDPDFIANLFGWFSIKVNILSEIAKPVPLLPKTWALPKNIVSAEG
jgi:hypothetical protein